MSIHLDVQGRGRMKGLALVSAIVVVELLALSLLYQHNFEFTCRDAAPEPFCAFAGLIVPRALGVIAGLILFALARREALADLLTTDGPKGVGLLLNAVGFVLILLPWAFVSDQSGQATVFAAAVSWSLGGVLAAVGACLILAPAVAWRELFARHGLTLLLIVIVGLMLPELAAQLMPLWRIEAVTEMTFSAVIWCLELIGYTVHATPADKIIGANDFYVAVGAQCSGVEGFALITVFLTIYLVLFRSDLRFPHVLVLYPVGVLLSWCFNVLRITALLSLGAEVSPELAIGGFHSHAGWLAFTLLSIGLIVASRSVPALRSRHVERRATSLPPFFADPVVAQVLPFVIFMATALLASTFSQTPTMLYPWRVLITGIGLALFWPFLKALPWRMDGIAVLAGLLVGAGWIVTSASSDAPLPFGALTGGALVIWVVARIIGTTVLVPVLEELMFRSYILGRIAGLPLGRAGQITPWRAALGLAVSSGLFAMLHGRWIEALIAGVVFGALYLRSRNITDAILAHALANLTIAAFALVTGAWHIL